MLAGVEEKARKLLLASPFDRPLEWRSVSQYLRGHILGARDHLAAEGEEYPIIRWERSIKSFTRKETGEYNLEVQQSFTATLGDGVMFRPESHEVWGPQRDPPSAT